jgi:hypothetical protein
VHLCDEDRIGNPSIGLSESHRSGTLAPHLARLDRITGRPSGEKTAAEIAVEIEV